MMPGFENCCQLIPARYAYYYYYSQITKKFCRYVWFHFLQLHNFFGNSGSVSYKRKSIRMAQGLLKMKNTKKTNTNGNWRFKFEF